MNQQKQNGNLIAIITMFFLFAMISFVTNLAAPFGTIWKNQYAGANTLGMMGNMMNFLAYLFMGIPAGNMLVKIGYKKTALIAMAVGFLGLFTQYLSSLVGADVDVFNMGAYAIKLNFIIYLLGAFICGFLRMYAQYRSKPHAEPSWRRRVTKETSSFRLEVP